MHARWKRRYRALLVASHRRGADAGTETARGGHWTCVECERTGRCGICRKARGRPGSVCGSRESADARGTYRTHTREVCRSEHVPDANPHRTGASRNGGAERYRSCPCAAGGPGGADRDARSGARGDTALLGQPSSLSPGARCGCCTSGMPGARNHRDRFEPPRAARRSTAGISCRRGTAVRHPDGHWRISRYAPASALRADPAGIHRTTRLRNAA